MPELIKPPVRIIYYSGKTRNTARFASKLQMSSYRISDEDETAERAFAPYILITPTYATGRGADAVPKQVENFLSFECHWKNLKGVIGSGNRNFGASFGLAADIISQRHSVPLLHKFELFGMPSDITTSSQRIDQCLLTPQTLTLR